MDKIIPTYESLGPLSFAWAQGSLVSGYTAEGDYDVILAWDMERLPSDRATVVSELDERNPDEPFIVDHRDINIDRFVIGDLTMLRPNHATPPRRSN